MKNILKKIDSINKVNLCEYALLLNLAVFVFTYVFSKVSYVPNDYAFIDNLSFIRYITVIIFMISIIARTFIISRRFFDMIFVVFTFAFLLLEMYVFNEYPISHMHNQLLTYFLAIVACKDINYRKIIKFLFCVLLSYAIVYVLLALLGFSVIGWGMPINSYQQRVRYTISVHPNTLAYMTFYLFLAYVYLRNNNIKNFEFVPLIIVNYVMFYLLNTRSVFVLINLFLLVIALTSYIHGFYRLLYFLKIPIILSPIILVILSYVLSVNFTRDVYILHILNSVLSGRLELANNALSAYNAFSLFGNSVLYNSYGYWENTVRDSTYIDMTLLNFLIRYGVVTYILFSVALGYFVYLAFKKKDIILIVVFCFFMIFSTFNDDLFVIENNFFLFIWSYKNYHIYKQLL